MGWCQLFKRYLAGGRHVIIFYYPAVNSSTAGARVRRVKLAKKFYR